jgi:hypothetical protein
VSVAALQVAAGTNPCSISASGILNFGLDFSSGVVYYVSGGTQEIAFGKTSGSNVQTAMVGSAQGFAWSSGTNPASSNADTNITRNAAGVIQIGTGAANALGSLQLNLITSYGGNTTTKGGVPSVLATSFLTAQTSAIANHALVSSASAFAKGMWRISFVATQTRAGSAGTVLGGTTGFTITFTNANGDAVSKTTALSAPATGIGTSTSDTISGDFYGYAGASTNITYSFGYTAGGVTGGAFDIAVYAEYLG